MTAICNIQDTEISGGMTLLLIICMTHIEEAWSQSKLICIEHSTKLTNTHIDCKIVC